MSTAETSASIGGGIFGKIRIYSNPPPMKAAVSALVLARIVIFLCPVQVKQGHRPPVIMSPYQSKP